MPYGEYERLCLYEIAGCPLMLRDGKSLGTIEGLKKHKGGCEVLLIKTDDGQEMHFPIYEQIVVECVPDEHLIVDPPEDLLQMFLEGRNPENPCEIVKREVTAHKKKMNRAA